MENINILIVDDDISNRKTLDLLLEDFENLNIEEVEDGQQAIDICKIESFDIIFMDIMMPNVDGIEATKEICSFDDNVMVIALSALDDESSKSKMLTVGAEDYITKPIEFDLFHQRVKNYLKIVTFRKVKPQNSDALNPFTQEVFSRSTTFKVSSQKSLSEFWDYYLHNTKKIQDLEECIRIIYVYCEITLNSGSTVTITAEENNEDLFFMLSPLSVISDTIVKNTLKKSYPEAIYIFENSQLSFRLLKYLEDKSDKLETIVEEKKESKHVSEYEQKILSKTHFNKLTAAEYVETTAISLIDKIENLESIEDEMEAITIKFELELLQEELEELTQLLDTYVSVILDLMDFEHFAYALKSLNEFFKTLEVSSLDAKDKKKFSILFLHLLDDIREWRNKIFIKKDANDIHYLDSSLLSSCLQVQSIFEKQEVIKEDEDDFELF
jgi:two-component system chemotaxis response regulator CheY